MKNKLYFVAILTLFLVSLIFFVICEMKNIKQKKEKDENINELNTKVAVLEKAANEKASEYNDLEIKYNELSSENEQLVITIEGLKEEMVIEEVTTEEVTEAEVVTTTQKKLEETTEAPEPKTEATTAAPKEEKTTEKVEEKPIIEDNAGGNALQYSAKYETNTNRLTRSNGVVYYNGHKETWYSTNEACGQATAVSIPGKHVADDGTIRDADGYICVASSDLSFYTVVDTTLGPGKVYDCGCSHGTIDVYTNW